MYQNILITIIAVIMLLWFLYDSVPAGIIQKPGKAISKVPVHSVHVRPAPLPKKSGKIV